MKKTILLIYLLISVVWICSAFADWESTLTLSRETSNRTVTFGVGSEVKTLSASPDPPAYFCSIKFNRYFNSEEPISLSKDVRLSGDSSYCWGVTINPKGNEDDRYDEDRTSNLSWDFSEIDGSFMLKMGDDCNGPIVADMKSVQNYSITGKSSKKYFNIVYTAGTIHTITATAGPNGTIAPSGIISVNDGDDQTFNINSNDGYVVEDVLVDEISVGAVTSYTFQDVTTDHIIIVSFKQDPLFYTIAAVAGPNGTIDPSGDVVVNHGESQTFTIDENDGYTIDQVVIDGTEVVNNPSYTFNGVTANHLISVTFKKKSYIINATAGTGGSINPSGNVVVMHGDSQTFTISKEDEYEIDRILVDGNEVANNPSYTFNEVTANHLISVSFNMLFCDINLNPTFHDFGSRATSITQIFTISNSGNGICNITDININGTNASSFSIVNDNCSDQSLESSGNCNFGITFPTQSATSGDNFASLNITSNDPDTPTLSADLQGFKTSNPRYPFTCPTLTSTFMDIYGVIYDAFDNSISDGDVIAAFVEDGNGGQLTVGCGIYGENVSESYSLHIYGNDSEAEKNGMAVGDTIVLKIYDQSEDITYTASVIDGDPSWTERSLKEVNWKLRIKQAIPLFAGWNLISFSVNNCYYVNEIPTVSMLEGIEYIKVNSIDDILASLNDQYQCVRGFDETGGLDYIKNPLSNLKYMAAGYGYWIKINEDADFDENGYIYLELEGINISPSKSITLRSGWNLVGHLGNQVKYKNSINGPYDTRTTIFPKLFKNDFLDDYITETSVDSISEIFQSIEGKYGAILGSDINGAKSYYPAILQASDMRYTGPGYGYWIKVTDDSATNLVWQQ